MTQRRKKATSFQKQKIAKAHHRNEFMRRLKQVINIINGKEICNTIPQMVFDQLYNTRIHSFKIIISPDCKVTSGIINDARETISYQTKNFKLIVIPGKLEVSLEEFVTVILPVSVGLENFIPDDLPGLTQFRRKLEKFNTCLKDTINVANRDITCILLSFGFHYNDIGKTLYWLNHEITTTVDLKQGIVNLVTINSFKIESASIKIDNINRPVIRMGYVFPNFGIDWISIKPSGLQFETQFADVPLDVYIQTHALMRLSERIDCFPTGSVHYHMFQSLKAPVVFYDINHNTLIEYRYFGTKAGYFVIDIIEGKLVIRTFLFVTNNGSPEGIKLNNITGLQKLDKKYLAIDRLSTFMSSDLAENAKIRSIFTSAGCRCLIDLYENCKNIATNTSKHFDSDLMLKYIDYDKKYLPESIQPRPIHRTQPT